jgi:hypothetical protein
MSVKYTYVEEIIYKCQLNMFNEEKRKYNTTWHRITGLTK